VLVLCLAAGFLLANLAVRGHAFYAATGGAWTTTLALAGAGLVTLACLLRPSLLGPALSLFGASFCLYGFHSYRLASQSFELLLTALALALLLRLARGHGALAPPSGAPAFMLLLYALLATVSLLLIPVSVLEHRLFLEGGGIGHAVLAAFPNDPLYPIASVNRLWLFVLFAALLAAQSDGRGLYRRLFGGIAWSAIAAVVLGLLDFSGVLPLDRYNLSRLFYGAQYRRLQSSFGNPSWFACFVACVLPFVLLEFRQARGWARMALAVAFPLCAAGLFLSGARAAWLAVLVVLAALVAAGLVAYREGRPLEKPDAPAWLALGSTVATVTLLVVIALTTPATIAPGDSGPPGRLEGLSREMQYRGVGLTSPRRLAAAYALELARLKPLLGLGHESFNLHLRAQLEIPGSGVSKVMSNTVTKDASETVFDDSHNTYLQVLTGTGALGLAVWIALASAGLAAAARAFRRDFAPEALAVLLGLLVFHFYGLFQGMAYVPMTFCLLPLLTGYATKLDAAPTAPADARFRKAVVAAAVLVVGAAFGYARDNGYTSLKRRLGVTAYLPDEAAEFEGFYRAETGAAGEFRWMGGRGIVNLRRAQPFRLRFSCENPGAEHEPVVLSWRFEGRDAGQVVFRRPGSLEQSFSFDSPGALRLAVSRTFRPGGGDLRELGIAVSAIVWE